MTKMRHIYECLWKRHENVHNRKSHGNHPWGRASTQLWTMASRKPPDVISLTHSGSASLKTWPFPGWPHLITEWQEYKDSISSFLGHLRWEDSMQVLLHWVQPILFPVPLPPFSVHKRCYLINVFHLFPHSVSISASNTPNFICIALFKSALLCDI